MFDIDTHGMFWDDLLQTLLEVLCTVSTSVLGSRCAKKVGSMQKVNPHNRAVSSMSRQLSFSMMMHPMAPLPVAV